MTIMVRVQRLNGVRWLQRTLLTLQHLAHNGNPSHNNVLVLLSIDGAPLHFIDTNKGQGTWLYLVSFLSPIPFTLRKLPPHHPPILPFSLFTSSFVCLSSQWGILTKVVILLCDWEQIKIIIINSLHISLHTLSKNVDPLILSLSLIHFVIWTHLDPPQPTWNKKLSQNESFERTSSYTHFYATYFYGHIVDLYIWVNRM